MPAMLVTGGAGFIGSHIVERLLGLGHEVRVLDNLSTGFLENLDGVRDHPNLEITVDSVTNWPMVYGLTVQVDQVIGLIPLDRTQIDDLEHFYKVLKSAVDAAQNLVAFAHGKVAAQRIVGMVHRLSECRNGLLKAEPLLEEQAQVEIGRRPVHASVNHLAVAGDGLVHKPPGLEIDGFGQQSVDLGPAECGSGRCWRRDSRLLRSYGLDRSLHRCILEGNASQLLKCSLAGNVGRAFCLIAGWWRCPELVYRLAALERFEQGTGCWVPGIDLQRFAALHPRVVCLVLALVLPGQVQILLDGTLRLVDPDVDLGQRATRR